MSKLQRIFDRYFRFREDRLCLVLCFGLLFGGCLTCSPGRTGFRRRSVQKLSPLVFKQHVPNVPEHSLAASGPSEGRIRRGDERFKQLVPNYNADIVWADRHGTGADRIMARNLKERLDMLAISVQNTWPGVRLRVIAGFDEYGHHARDSLHHSGRAVDLTTSDRDITKNGLLARMAVNVGFDFVYYESRSHVHCSVRKEKPSIHFSGCFHGKSRVITRNGSKTMKNLKIGDEIASGFKTDGSLSFNKVIAFLHKDEHMRTNFVQLGLESDQILLLTTNHLMFRHVRKPTEKCNAGEDCFTNPKVGVVYSDLDTIHAENVLPGDFVYTKSPNDGVFLSRVTNVTISEMVGVYAPLTDDGTLVVDDVYVSCYAVITNHQLAHAVFFPVRFFNWLISWQIDICKSSELFSGFQDYLETRLASINDDEEQYIHWYARLLFYILSIFNKI